MNNLEAYFHQFQQYSAHQGDIFLYQYDGQESSYTIHLSGIIHGNEVGSLPTLLALIEDLERGLIKFGGRINITLGNPEASRQDKRFIDADLNRLFLKDQPHEHIDTHEGKRARALMPILDQSDLILDLHQTMLPSAMPFYIFPNTPIARAIAEGIGGTKAYIDATPTEDKPTYQCADEYVWRQGKPALTLELGEMGFHQPATDAATEAVRNLIALIEMLRAQHALQNPHTMLSLIQSRSKGQLSQYRTVHREPYGQPDRQLAPGFINFQEVTKGEVLSAANTPAIVAPCSGRLLFPKYPSRDEHGQVNETLPKEIFRIIQTM